MTSPALSPILLECAKPQPEGDALRASASPATDWDAVLSQAASHGLSPLLYWELRRHCPDLVPAPVLEELRTRFLANAGRNLLLDAELVRLASVFEKATIDVLIFKGPAISWTLYENPALRTMSDLDLLVRPSDAGRAYRLLLAEGYEPFFKTAHWEFVRCYRPEVPLCRPPVTIDLHWQTSNRDFLKALDFDTAWRSRRPIQVAENPVLTFGAEDLLLYLAVHGAKHYWSSLTWLADLARLITREAIDWPGVVERAKAARLRRALPLALILLRDLLGVAVPADAEELLDDPVLDRMAAALRRSLLAGPQEQPVGLSRIFFLLKMSDSLRFKAALLLDPFHPNIADQLWCRFPPWLSPLYYVTRPFRLVVKHAPGLLSTRSSQRRSC